MPSTNILDLNNRVSELEGTANELVKSYPADKVMMSDGVTSVEDALDALKSDLSKIYVGNYIDAMSTKTFNVKKMYCHMLFSTRTNSVSMITYGKLVDMVNASNLTVTVTETEDYNLISITNNNNLSTNIVLL